MEHSENSSVTPQPETITKYWCFMCEKEFTHPYADSAEVYCPQCNCISELIENNDDPRSFKPFDAQKEGNQNPQPTQSSQVNNSNNNASRQVPLQQANAPIMGFNVIYHTSASPLQTFTLQSPFPQAMANPRPQNAGNIPPQNQNMNGFGGNFFNPFLNNALGMMNAIFTGNPLQGGNLFGDIEGRIIEEFLRNDPNRHGPPPAPQGSIDKLKKSAFSETCKVKDCSVCQEDYKNGDNLLTMPCDHIFHKGCLEKWLGMHNSCPSCRKPLGPERDSYSENMFA